MVEILRWLVVPLAVIAACNNSGEPTGSTCPTGSTLTYTSFGQSFMQQHCTSCHSSSTKGEHPLLDTVAEIRSNASAIDKEAASGPNATNTGMPDDGDVATSDRQKLGEWLACGSP